MTRKILIATLATLMMGAMNTHADNLLEKPASGTTDTREQPAKEHRLTIGGYGEAVASRDGRGSCRLWHLPCRWFTSPRRSCCAGSSVAMSP